MAAYTKGLPAMAEQPLANSPMPTLQQPSVISSDGMKYTKLERTAADLGDIAPGCGHCPK